jgi:RNA polymerase sigma factor (TIGR02999 family)
MFRLARGGPAPDRYREIAAETGSGGVSATREPGYNWDAAGDTVARTGASKPITAVLAQVRRGDGEALNELMQLVYVELRRLAADFLRRERPGHTLPPTGLVHEAFLRLAGQHSLSWENRAHFFAAAARVMRRILVDHARARATAKRAGLMVSLTEASGLAGSPPLDVLALEDALNRLSDRDPHLAQIVELRFFVGLSIEEAADVLQVSASSVKRKWTFAKAWLGRELLPQEAPPRNRLRLASSSRRSDAPDGEGGRSASARAKTSSP